jgi:hypothetical protein
VWRAAFVPGRVRYQTVIASQTDIGGDKPCYQHLSGLADSLLRLTSLNVIIFYMESENFDISALSYEEFVEYFFTTPSGEFFELDANRHEYWLAEINDPAAMPTELTEF